jgi:YidC/Oxa1 family membrane protein insertase
VLTVAIKMLLLPIDLPQPEEQHPHARPEAGDGRTSTPSMASDDAMKKQQATMDLYRKAGVNPVAGLRAHAAADARALCHVPLLPQQHRVAPAELPLGRRPEQLRQHLSTALHHSSLRQPREPVHHADGASTIIYTLVNSKQMPQQQGMPNMKLMMYLFPVMMLFFMNSLPAGLSYYYLLANVISILQMTVITKWFLDEGQAARGTCWPT